MWRLTSGTCLRPAQREQPSGDRARGLQEHPEPHVADRGNTSVRAGPSRVAWFQVMRSHPAPDGVPLQAFITCVRDVMPRVGRLRLAAAQVRLPADEVGEGVMMASRSGTRVAEAVLSPQDPKDWHLRVPGSRRSRTLASRHYCK